MIKVTVELLPGGGEEGRKVLSEVFIYNDLTGTLRRGNYRVKRHRFGPDDAQVLNFPRQSYSALELVRRALEALHVAKGKRAL